MSHPHTIIARHGLTDHLQRADSMQSLDIVGHQHTRNLACPNSSQDTPGPHNLEMITVDDPGKVNSHSAVPTSQMPPTSSLTHLDQGLFSDSKALDAVQKDRPAKTSHIVQAAGPLPGLSIQRAHNHSPKPHQTGKTLDQASGFWERFNKAADFEDREFVKALGGNMDTLLIFAGLFSGVNTAFIIEALKTIQPDQAQKTNDLIHSILLVLQNATTEHSFHDEPFIPTPRHVRCTIIFFASLCCSLTAAFGAVLGKQWLNYYEREGVLKPPPGRGRERQKKYEGRSHWHMEGIMETLPTILQISLFLFLIALVDLMFPVNKTVAFVVMGFSLIPAVFYIGTTTIATLHPLSPFQTRLSITIRSVPDALGYLWDRLKDMLKRPLVDLARMIWFWRWVVKKPPMRELGWIGVFSSVFLMLPLCFLWRLVTLLPVALWSFVVEGTTLPDVILDLKCLIFCVERTSGSDELNHIIEAIGALPPDLQGDGGHPIVASFCEVLFKFVIKPIYDLPTLEYTSKLTKADFRQLLNALHFLHKAWFHMEKPQALDPFLGEYNRLILNGLSSVFTQEPENSSLAALIADILEEAYDHVETEMDQALVWECLQRPFPLVADSMPYISLLSTDTITQKYLSNPIEFEALVDRLRSTMWINGELDTSFSRSKIRAQILSKCPGETENHLRFSCYLAKCCQKYFKALTHSTAKRVRSQAHIACSYYLVAIFRLLNCDKSSLWPQQLEKNSIAHILLQILQSPKGVDIHGLALLCFVSLWYRRRGSDNLMVMDDAGLLYLAPDAVDNVAASFETVCLINYHKSHRRMVTSQVALGLVHTVKYFEAASRLGLLKPDKKSIASDFRLTAQLYPQSYGQLQEQLLERMDNLSYS